MTETTETKPKTTRARKASTKTREKRTSVHLSRGEDMLSISLRGCRISTFVLSGAKKTKGAPVVEPDAKDARAIYEGMIREASGAGWTNPNATPTFAELIASKDVE